MRKIVSIIILMLFASSLSAQYLRSVRIGSFLQEKDAQESLSNLKKFVLKHENVLNLQDENDFIFKARKSGKYYITLVEPFRNRVVLQEVLDTLRLEYEGIYVTKLKASTFEDKNIETIEKEVIPELVEADITEEELKVIRGIELAVIKDELKEIELEEVEILEPEVQKKKVDIQMNLPVVVSQESSLEKYVWEVLFFLTFAMLLFLIRSRHIYKKENETYINKELINSEKLEQTIVEMKSKEQFLSYVSHELRTPMTAIMGLTHLVLENDLSKSQRDYVQRIESSSKHLLNIINDILDISKLQAAELKIEKIEFNINDILEYVLNVVSVQAKNNNINISMDVDNDIPSHVLGDSLRLGQVLINLLANSVKFTKDGEVTLGVKKLESIGDSIRLEFVVSDTGIGMAEEQIENIFLSYAQANESTSRKFGGTGLGLSISKQLVELMNGEIKVHSKKDIGSSFTFNILFGLSDSQNKRQYRLPTSGLLGKKILIVDSTNKNVISLIRSLGYFKYKTHSIPSFEEAVLDKDIKYDIIIINQLSITRYAIDEIGEMKDKYDSKVVVLNELYNSLHNELFDSMRVDAYLRTPFTQQSILNMIVELYVSKNLNERSRKIRIKDKLTKFSDRKILVVEDNIVNHKVITGLLSQTGIELVFALNGQEAVDLVLKGIHFDLILMDINMPIMNGYEATQEIRKHKKYNNLPILALTADVMDSAIEKASTCGMQGHISKPIIVDIFYKKILDSFKGKTRPKEEIVQEPIKESGEYEELSISVGLGRCDNDRKFYKSILTDFKVMYGNSSLLLDKLCREGKFREARSMAMDIKDVALNIGAYNLCENAATMEYEFEKGSRSNWRKLVDFYTFGLDRLFKDIDKYIDKS